MIRITEQVYNEACGDVTRITEFETLEEYIGFCEYDNKPQTKLDDLSHETKFGNTGEWGIVGGASVDHFPDYGKGKGNG